MMQGEDRLFPLVSFECPLTVPVWFEEEMLRVFHQSESESVFLFLQWVFELLHRVEW